ncbi:MAG: beta-N-acetylhexosaminidase [Treponema sp.]|jgi:beta-N-acetylhexosaminidase|nr:beta-N-acetylhexosaminidase [Treponema sp.]
MTLQHNIGQHFIIGFDGPALTPEFRRLVGQYKAGNVILFKENLQSAAQAKALCGDIKALILEETGLPPFIAIDQEGGRVSRLPADMTNIAGAADLAADGVAAIVEAAALTAAELRRIGVNFNLAPVLDVNSNPANPVIGARSFGAEPELVADLGAAAVAAWERTGILCCGKHFPGHGDTSVDSHLELPCVDKTRAELEAVELPPFRRAIARGIPALMSAHILFPQLEPRRVPATMSKIIITGLLREELGFKGLVLSDAMEMNAIKQYYGAPRGCIEAIRAGVDIVLVCHDAALMEASLAAVAETYTNGGFDSAAFDASTERITQYKRKYA